MQTALQPKLILVAILAAYAMPQLAFAENRAEAIELGKIEVVGVTPLSSLGVRIATRWLLGRCVEDRILSTQGLSGQGVPYRIVFPA